MQDFWHRFSGKLTGDKQSASQAVKGNSDAIPGTTGLREYRCPNRPGGSY